MSLEPVGPLQEGDTALAHWSTVPPQVANSTPLAPPRNIRTSVDVLRWWGVTDRSAAAWRFLSTMCEAIVLVLVLGDLCLGLPLPLLVKAIDVKAGEIARATSAQQERIAAPIWEALATWSGRTLASSVLVNGRSSGGRSSGRGGAHELTTDDSSPNFLFRQHAGKLP